MTELRKPLPFRGIPDASLRLYREEGDFQMAVARRTLAPEVFNDAFSLMELKDVHTGVVECATVDLIEKMGGYIEETVIGKKGIVWNIAQAMMIANQHDVMRREEARLHRCYNGTGYGHAGQGAVFIRMHADVPGGVLYENAQALSEAGIDVSVVYGAVRDHSDLTYAGDDPYAMLIRDADKTGIIDWFDYLRESTKWENKGSAVRKEVLEELKDGKMLVRRERATRSETVLLVASWWNDINFEATRKLWTQRGYMEKLLMLMKDLGMTQDDWEQAYAAVDAWMRRDGYALDFGRLTKSAREINESKPFHEHPLLSDVPPSIVSYIEEKFDRHAARLDPKNNTTPVGGVVHGAKPEVETLSQEERRLRNRMAYRKKVHTLDTVEDAVAVHHRMSQSGEWKAYPINLTLAKIIALIHDGERPAEAAIHGSWEGARTKFDHARLMALHFSEDFGINGIYQEEGEQLETLGYSRNIIAEATAEHSKPEYTGPFFEAHFMRDADKTSITGRFDWLCEDKIHGAVVKEFFLSESTLAEFEAKGMVTNGNMYTPLDGLLRTLAWWKNIHFRSTKEIWHERGYIEKILNQLNRWHISPGHFQRVLRVVEGWMQLDGFTLDTQKL